MAKWHAAKCTMLSYSRENAPGQMVRECTGFLWTRHPPVLFTKKYTFQPLVMRGRKEEVNKIKGTQNPFLWRPPWLPFSFLSPSVRLMKGSGQCFLTSCCCSYQGYIMSNGLVHYHRVDFMVSMEERRPWGWFLLWGLCDLEAVATAKPLKYHDPWCWSGRQMCGCSFLSQFCPTFILDV